MLRLNKILVGADFNTQSGVLPVPTQSAIEKSIALAKASGAELIFLSVLTEEETGTDLQIEGTEKLDARQLVAAAIEPFLEQADEKKVSVTFKTAVGQSWQELTKEAIRESVDLVVVGTREKSAAQQMMYGSTAMKLLRNCPTPVWITRPDIDPEDITTVVAADDFHPVGDKILNVAVTASQYLSARLLIVHAVDFPLEGGLARTECSDEELEKYREKVREDARQQLTNRLAQTDYRTLDQGSQVLIQAGPPETVIEEAVVDHKADLLVIGTLARGGIYGFLIGNTAERLFSRLKCSLLAVKPDDFVSPVQVD